MKSKFLFLILAVFAVVMMPLTATSQIAPDKPPRTEAAEASPKYEIFVGAGYTSLNNVNQSRNGQLGVDVSVTRDWGKYFGITADGGTYKYPYDATNPGNPTVDMLLFGPVIHAHLLGRADVFLHVLLGCEHISGTAVATGGSSTTSTQTLCHSKRILCRRIWRWFRLQIDFALLCSCLGRRHPVCNYRRPASILRKHGLLIAMKPAARAPDSA